MGYFILVLVLVVCVGLGITAGWFLSLLILGALTAVAGLIGWGLVRQANNTPNIPTGMAQVFGIGIVLFLLGLFTLSMWVTSLIVRVSSVSAGLGLSGQPIAEFFLR